jgi:hypothetical protein
MARAAKGWRFCVSCHKTAGNTADHLFFVPDKYMKPFLLLEHK